MDTSFDTCNEARYDTNGTAAEWISRKCHPHERIPRYFRRPSLISVSSVFRIFQSRVLWATWTARKSPIRARTVARYTITTPAWRGIWSTNVAWNPSSTVPSVLTERSTSPAWTPTWMAGIWNFWANSTRCRMGISCHPPWTLETNLLRRRLFYFLLETRRSTSLQDYIDDGRSFFGLRDSPLSPQNSCLLISLVKCSD